MSITESAKAQTGPRAMTVEDLLSVKSVGGLKLSPNGQTVAYSVSVIDKKTGKSNSDIWLLDLGRGAEPKQLTTSSASDSEPAWTPDGKSIVFVSRRSGTAQIWQISVDGGEARQITNLPIDVTNGPVVSPDGKNVAFSAQVYPGKSAQETADEDKRRSEIKSSVKTFDSLMIRHWDTYDDGKRSHIFVANLQTGEAHDTAPSLKVNSPPAPFGGSTEYTFTGDSKAVIFTAEPLKDHAWSTNTDLWMASVEGGDLKNLTSSNQAADAQPAVSPDGRHLAYVRQIRAGFEADLWVLTILDLESGQIRELTRSLDRPVHGFSWTHDGKAILAEIENQGHQDVFRVDPTGITEPELLFGGRGVHASVASGSRNGVIAYTRSDSSAPAEIFTSRVPADGPVVTKRISTHNDDLVSQLDLSPAESFTFKGADNDDVQGWIIKPPGFDASRKYPVLFLIHGGPQGAWNDVWHARWNSALFAAPGYVVVAINPRGSTGFGQKFTDQISRDWNGRVYTDLMNGLDHALKTNPYMDADRVGAAGGSYGGYMVNWIAGQTDRFKCLISHAGVWDLPSMYGTTEELWFAEWEFGGPPWEKEFWEGYVSQSPSTFAGHIKTPVLVTHGSLDYRVPEAQGFGLFTALQRRGVPSRLVLFPDENHWILKMENRRVWWNEMHQWLKTYLKP